VPTFLTTVWPLRYSGTYTLDKDRAFCIFDPAITPHNLLIDFQSKEHIGVFPVQIFCGLIRFRTCGYNDCPMVQLCFFSFV
jgi:hypothetical protein